MAKRFRRIVREEFDRDRDFVTTRSLPVSGRVLGPNEPFDKTLVTTRRLRQLYEARRLRFTDEGENVADGVAGPTSSPRTRPRRRLKEAA